MIRRLQKALCEDGGLFYGYQSNIAMAFVDQYHAFKKANSSKGYVTNAEIHQIANRAAINFLEMFIKDYSEENNSILANKDGWIEDLMPLILHKRIGAEDEPLDGDEACELSYLIRDLINLNEGNMTEEEFRERYDAEEEVNRGYEID